MAGKSTYLRQVGLIAVLTHLGSFVPAAEAEIGLCDRVFTRVGAQDSLARGQSTFLVEMIETSRILHHATPRSLVLLDEVGRGTSTYDGLAIAWAVAEALESPRGSRPRTLFATHFHELTRLAAPGRGFVNLNVEVKEWGDRVGLPASRGRGGGRSQLRHPRGAARRGAGRRGGARAAHPGAARERIAADRAAGRRRRGAHGAAGGEGGPGTEPGGRIRAVRARPSSISSPRPDRVRCGNCASSTRTG